MQSATRPEDLPLPSACPVCRRSEIRRERSKAEVPFARCTTCSYVWAHPMPDEETLTRLYDRDFLESSYHPDRARDRDLMRMRELQYERDRELLLRFVDGGEILDYGCGNGRFVLGFPASFRKWGFELNAVAREELLRGTGLQVLESPKEIPNAAPGGFDVITMRGVIEHLPDPERVLRQLVGVLKPGGYLFLCATPNIDSPCALVHGQEWNQFVPPYHLHYFSPRTLAVLGARHGLGLLHSETPYLDTPYADFDRDGPAFLEAVADFLTQRPTRRSAPYAGTMMSLVFRRLG